ncbi:GUN4 domain-containing protein [Tolypothrix sp. PCC 7910]|uniref:GUN4 domain-containing protein n=1 Tax=Tolypothrix sp. PCC 7910 TaxID=2099387 RepID=UPI0014278582|nr:GUN4 domain-containing protein [Tolypothrix sp. PCC 7910]QIR38822.1 GUN4 domain-containing protein [Tolypothrix sp. PCC 7910]
MIDNIVSNLLTTTTNIITKALNEIVSGYGTSAFVPSLVKNDMRYIEAIIKSQAISENNLDELTIKLRADFSQQLLKLLGEWQANQVQHQLKHIRNFFETRNLSTIFSQEETYKILGDKQTKHRLVVLLAPPNISPHCPSSFQHDLLIELPEKLKSFLHKDYPLNSDLYPVEFYGDYFLRAISDSELLQLQQILAPIPTVVLHSKITDYEVYFDVNFWYSSNSKIAKIHLPAWNWEEAYEALQASDYNNTRAIRTIRQIIVTLHQLLAAFITDWYYLNLSPIYEPQLFYIEPKLALAQCSSEILQPYIDALRDMCLQHQQAFQEAINDLMNEKIFKNHNLIIGIQEPMLKPEYFIQTQGEGQIDNKTSIIDYSKLQNYLLDKNWREADRETTEIILSIICQETQDLDWEQVMMNQIFLSKELIHNFPCEDLRIIDRLWLNHSNLHFGFSIQTCIWQKVSPHYENFDLNCKSFTKDVAWVVNGSWLIEEQIIYGLHAPLGHLPFDFTRLFIPKDLKNLNHWGYWYELYYRLQHCAL